MPQIIILNLLILINRQVYLIDPISTFDNIYNFIKLPYKFLKMKYKIGIYTVYV